jgi:hypothetical protein
MSGSLLRSNSWPTCRLCAKWTRWKWRRGRFVLYRTSSNQLPFTLIFQVNDLRSQVAGLALRLGEERLRADREADAAARLRAEIAVAKLQEQQAVSREVVMGERNEKLQGELLVMQGRLQEVEQQFGEQQTLMNLQQTQQMQHQQQQHHHAEELRLLRVQRDTWEAEVRHSKGIVSELVATNARLQVNSPHIKCDVF